MDDRNNKILFWASFLTLIAAGMGFSIRGSILDAWGDDFGFTQTELGTITGGGLVGFGVTIIVFSFLVDRLGYGMVMGFAFFFHVASVVVTIAAQPVFDAYGKEAAYWCLYAGTFLFALGNGTCEAVINPLTASLYPKNKTHWLNILHAGWPGGLILGAVLGLGFTELNKSLAKPISWEYQIATYIIPTLIYGALMFRRPFPKTETSEAGISMGTALLEFASPILLFLIVLHACVGYVELGTDSWIINITETILANKQYALLAFIWTNVLMFTLRFFAGPIVHRISPLGLLFVSAVIGAGGLLLLGQASTAWAWMGAVSIYGIAKTFFWPTMLGVVSERFPKGGALTLGAIGGIGMLSAGLFGGPGIGYKQDYFATQKLKSLSTETYDRYKSDTENQFLNFPKVQGLDNAKVALLNEKAREKLAKDLKKKSADEKLKARQKWLNDQGLPHMEKDKPDVTEATLYGGKMALTWTAVVPAFMAFGYLLLILYFKMRGGYKAEVLAGHAAEDEKFTGGTMGPGEG